MAKFKFIGDPNNEEVIPEVTIAFGVTFEKSKPSEVKDPRAIGKLRGNSHFKEVKANDKPAPEKKAEVKTDAKKGK